MSPSIATAAAPAVPRRALPTNESVSAQHPDLPGLAAVLDPERRAEVLAPIVGDPPMEVARLRLKPGTSVALALRPATGARRDLNTGRPHGWWRVLAFAPEPFAPKADKERIAAERTHLPILVDRELRLVVSPAETDRALRGLAWLRPDSGCLVSVEGRPRTVHTLSYNPDRRWVGMARDPLGRERSVLRMYADDGTLHVEPWAHGRAWSAGDSPDLLPALGAALAAGLHRRFGADRGAAVRGFDLAQLDQAARFLAGLDQEWGERADAVARSIAPRLGGLDLAPAHGDLSPDQVVVDDDGEVHLLDWDRAGIWPAGWDAATWGAGSTLFLPGGPRGPITAALPGHTTPDATVRAAAALLYTPDPFRRQFPDWAADIERLLTHAETVLS